MRVGIPRALLYYKNEKFWPTFLENIGVEYIISPDTNKDILTKGSNLAIDESCLPKKIFLGHINWLIDKCDYILVPRVAFCYGFDMCSTFLAQYDFVKNTFKDRNIKILYYNIDNKKINCERKAIYRLGKFLKIKRSQVKYAYIMAKQAQMYYEMFRIQNQEKLLKESKKDKILLVAHAYNIADKYVGEPVIKYLQGLGCDVIFAEYTNPIEAIDASLKVTKTLHWGYSRHLFGAVELLKDSVDGIILLTTFPCGPDSMVNEMLIRTYKDKPLISITIDSQDGTAGVETRLESFVDIINLRKEKNYEK